VIWTDDPEIRCQACTKRFSLKTSFEYKLDSEAECPHCGAVLRMVDEELTRRWTWSPIKVGQHKSDPAQRQSKGDGE
jgi:DNA-directed RNA polymerase subunit RPC12/RpoP